MKIERLIGLLDALDGDTDHEDCDEDFEPDADDEPWLAGFGGWMDAGDDRESATEAPSGARRDSHQALAAAPNPLREQKKMEVTTLSPLTRRDRGS